MRVPTLPYTTLTHVAKNATHEGLHPDEATSSRLLHQKFSQNKSTGLTNGGLGQLRIVALADESTAECTPMSRTYVLSRFLRQTPNRLLKQYFTELDLLGTIDLDVKEEASMRFARP
jgi:hypothetical protein